MGRIAALALAVLICAGLAAGCKKGAESGAPKIERATTPQQTLENMQAALLSGDSKAFADCFEASGEEAKALGAFAEFMCAAAEFSQAMEKAYGKEATGDSPLGGAQAQLTDKSWLDAVEITQEGDTATVTAEGESTPLTLVRTEGVWKIQMESMTGEAGGMEPGDADDAVKMFGAMAQAMRSSMNNIGKPGYTAEKINQEVGMAMMAAMMQGAMEKMDE